MKKILFVLSFLSMIPFAQGQISYKYGAFVMPQISQLSNADDDELAPNVYDKAWLQGMAAGVRFGVERGPVSLNLNLIYAYQGGKFTSTNANNEEVENVTRLQYVKIPLMIGAHTPEAGNKIVLAANVGVQANILAKAEFYNDNTAYEPGIPSNVTSYPSAYESFVPVELSFVGEGGIDVRLLPGMHMNLRLRGDYSLNDAENKDAIFLQTDAGETREVNFWQDLRGANRSAKTKNLSLGLLIGCSFTLY